MNEHMLKRLLQAAATPVLLGCLSALAEDGPSSSIYSRRLAEMQVQLLRDRQSRPYNEQMTPDAAAIAAGRPPSWYEVPPLPPREVKQGDLITLRIDMGARFNSDAQMQRRKTS